jgi:hypothetical protein
MRAITLLVIAVASGCGPRAPRQDVAKPGAYVFVAHIEPDREVGPLRADDEPARRGNFDVQRNYPSEAEAQQHEIHVRGHGGVDFVLQPGQCTKSCGGLEQAQHLHCEHGFEREEVVVSLGKSGGELGRRQCSGPAGTFELTPY